MVAAILSEFGLELPETFEATYRGRLLAATGCAEVAELTQRFCGGTTRIDYLAAESPTISLAP